MTHDVWFYILEGLVMFVICLGCTHYGYLKGRKDPGKPDGYFRVDTTNPDKDVFTLELACPIGEIPTKKYILFEVVNTSSQEKPLA